MGYIDASRRKLQSVLKLGYKLFFLIKLWQF
jgi:hypothetical protein